MPDPLVIGLVNNMPDAALRSTERQFQRLMRAAIGEGRAVEFRFIALPGLIRSERGRQHVDAHYEYFRDVPGTRLDGLIVTGTEPSRARLEDEPYWDAFAALVDFAQASSLPTLWSCLAAHAAVRCLDGISRRQRPQKLTGVFECTRAGVHLVTADLPLAWPVPHSHHNDLDEADLDGAGYRMLSRSEWGGVDMFTRSGDDLFLFLQGHPEYDPASLLLEYRRDLGRAVAGAQIGPAAMPQHYLTDAAEQGLAGAADDRARSALLQHWGDAAVRSPGWQVPAARLYAGWLHQVAAQGVARMQRFAGRERRAGVRAAVDYPARAASITGTSASGLVVGG